jgi:UDPglucose 6-dehydrogenase
MARVRAAEHGTSAGRQNRPAVSVVGLGRLGIGLATTLACSGFDVVGIDTDERVVQLVNLARAPFAEPGLTAALAQSVGTTLRASLDIAAAAAHAEIAFFLLSTPSGPGGEFQFESLRDAILGYCRAIRSQPERRHILVVSSTVSPGTILGSLVPAIEEASGLRVGERIGLCYNPELVSLGSMLTEFRSPDLVIIGESDRDSGNAIEAVHRRIAANRPKIHRMSIASAEIAKLSLNNYLILKISFANLLSQICSRVEGAELDKIVAALGSDSRIGARFLQPGTAFGGPCFPRDIKAFVRFAREWGCSSGLLQAAETVNLAQQELLADIVRREAEIAGTRRVGILGVTYKSSTPFVEASAAVDLIKRMQGLGIQSTVYDELSVPDLRYDLDGVEFAPSAAACIEAAPLVVLINAHASYLQAIRGYAGSSQKVVIDCWRALSEATLANVRVVKLGYFG